MNTRGTKVGPRDAAPWCVKHRDGWCVARSQKGKYADSMGTLCRHVVTLPWGVEKRKPTCDDCAARLERAARKGAR